MSCSEYYTATAKKASMKAWNQRTVVAAAYLVTDKSYALNLW
jgi:hypothetical protein